MWYVYIIECKDGTLYTGVTTDVTRRFNEHATAQGAKYTRTHGVSKLLYNEAYESKSDAYRREAQIKRWTRVKKLHLIQHGCTVLGVVH